MSRALFTFGEYNQTGQTKIQTHTWGASEREPTTTTTKAETHLDVFIFCVRMCISPTDKERQWKKMLSLSIGSVLRVERSFTDGNLGGILVSKYGAVAKGRFTSTVLKTWGAGASGNFLVLFFENSPVCECLENRSGNNFGKISKNSPSPPSSLRCSFLLPVCRLWFVDNTKHTY